MSIEINSEEEVQNIVLNTKMVVMKWGAGFCQPCKKIQPFFESLAQKYPNVAFLTLDVEEPDLTERVDLYNISSIPHFQVFLNGKLKKSMTGTNKKELEEMFSNLLID